jgi:ParB/RepB/Spo0J family partition protein
MSELYETQTKEFTEIAVSAISSTPDKKNFGRGDPEKDPKVKELAENMKHYGLLHPITIIESADSTPEKKDFEVVIGKRRFAAWKIAHPDHPPIKCLILPKETTTTRKDMLTVSENLLRVDYDPQDKGKVVQMLLPYWDNDINRLAKALGYETAAVLNDWLAMLDVPEEVMDRLVGPETLRAKRAKLIRKLPLPLQIPAADIINEKGGDTYDVRRFIYALKANPTASPREIAEMIETKPRTKSLMVSISENINLALEAAVEDTRETKSALGTIAIKEFLTKHGYLDSEGKVVKKLNEQQ